MLIGPRIVACALLVLSPSACNKDGAGSDTPESGDAQEGDGSPGSDRGKEITVALQPVELSQCQHKTTDSDPPEQVYSCQSLIASHMVVPDAAPADEATKAALDIMLSGLRGDSSLEIVEERDAQIPVAGTPQPGTALLVRNPKKGDSVAGYTLAEKDGSTHILFCMAPGTLFLEGRCDPVWDQLLAAQ